MIQKIISNCGGKIMNKRKKLKYIKYLIIIIVTVVLSIPVLFKPTKINKMLFKLISTNEFSSTNFKIDLVDMINKTESYHEPMKKISYLHGLSEKELDLIEEISLDYNFTTEDISKLRKIKTIYMDGIDFKNDMSITFENVGKKSSNF